MSGDVHVRTGGNLYDLQLIEALRQAGWELHLVELPGGFPFASDEAMATAAGQLAAVPADRPLIVDGLAWGALQTGLLAPIVSPVVALVHHPLAREPGLAAALAEDLAGREAANLALAASVVVPSPHTGDVLRTDFGVPAARIRIAAPGVRRPDPGARAPALPPLILSVGLLAHRKGHDTLLRALARLHDLPWQAAIVGRAHVPEVANALHAQAQDLGLGARVTFTGELGNEPLTRLYAQAHVFALATRYEGYGMVFAEALCHDLPIVSCRAGAVPQTVPPLAGTLVAVDDDAAFAAALRGLLTDAGLHSRMAEAARIAASALPQWADTASVMAEALEAAMSGKSGSP